jgi:hypothetical protein
VAAVVVVVAMALTGCAGPHRLNLPAPPPTRAVTTSSQAPDLSGVELTPVAGRVTTTAVAVRPGNATLRGIVLGPDGPVAGATVRLERLVDDATGKLDITTDGGGSWNTSAPTGPPATVLPPTTAAFPTVPGQITTPTVATIPTTPAPRTLPPTTQPPGQPPGILGGRYRVRAWRSPDLALTTPQILYLGGKDSQNLTLTLSRYTGLAVASNIGPNPPVVGVVADVAVLVTSQIVDAQGFVRGASVPGASVSLFATGAWLAASPTDTVSDSNGRADFRLVCQATGQQPLSIQVNGVNVFQLQLPACVLAPPLTTAPTISVPFGSSSSSSSVPGTTSTSKPR